MPSLAEEFEEHRKLLLGLAYRMLGSMWDAEDVLQEAFLRWMRTDRESVRDVRPFLATIVSRIALDQLKSARVARESYVGPWLPEPVAAEAFGPLDTAELRDSLSYATLHLMERLTPPERAVVVLRDAFEMPYDQIAEVIGMTAAACRQLHVRAGKHLAAVRDQTRPSKQEHEALLSRFLEAAAGGDLSALTDLLSADVTAWNDGGGKRPTAIHPVHGRDRVIAFFTNLARVFGVGVVRPAEVNGQPGLRMTVNGVDQILALNIHDGQIHDVYLVRNPDKLASFIAD